MVIVFLLYSVLMILFFEGHSKYELKEEEIVGIVERYQVDGDKLTIYLKGKEIVVVTYYFETEVEKEQYLKKLELGSQIKVNGKLEEASDNTVPNLFNYRKYLLYKKIYYLMKAKEIELLTNNTSLLYAVKNWMINRIDHIDETGYFRTFLLGDKSEMENDIVTSYQKNGVSHLFSISGMHVNFIAGILLFFLQKVTYQLKIQYGFVSLVLLFYLFLTGFGASILRTVIMFWLSALSRCYALKISKVDIMLLTLMVIILINPFILCDVGFQFSYGISLGLVLFQPKIRKIKNPVWQSVFISFLCFLISFPICVYHFNEVNFLSIIFNVIMIPVVSTVVFPFTMICFLIPVLYPVYEKLIQILEMVNTLVVSLDMFQVVFTKPNMLVIIIYYLVIGLVFWRWQLVCLFGIIMLAHRFFPYFDSRFLFVMLDVGQGDCLFIKLPYNQGNILIDTGGRLEYEQEKWQEREVNFSYADRVIVPYLNSLGIEKLDYLILSHGDYDHMGEAIYLVNNFKVDKVTFNNGEYNDLELELIKVLEEKNIKYYRNIKELNINNHKLYFLNNKIYNNENDNSTVIYFNYNQIKMLFMGDAGVEVEENILEKYQLNAIDILKVGHHGSKTSSSEEFINTINPKYSVISVGKNNRYRHPNKEVLESLKDSKIYRTDQEGSIMFKVKKNKLKIETCAP